MVEQAKKEDFEKRPRVPRGVRPFALGDRHVERVLSMLIAVSAEVSVLYDRYDTLARVLAAKGVLTLDELETFEPSDELEAEREAWRQAFAARMLRIMEEDLQEKSLAQREEQYRSFQQWLAIDAV